jgi:hypothetical protein
LQFSILEQKSLLRSRTSCRFHPSSHTVTTTYAEQWPNVGRHPVQCCSFTCR